MTKRDNAGRRPVIEPEAEQNGDQEISWPEDLRSSEREARPLREASPPRQQQSIERKLRAIEEAGQWNAPTGDPEQMLAEIESGRFGE